MAWIGRSRPSIISRDGAAEGEGMSRRRDIRLLLADVDGTLVTPDKILTAAAKAAARELCLAGIALAITSGRPPRGMRMLIRPLALRVAIAGFNGGVYVNPDLSVIESHTLAPATARQAMALMLDHGLDVWLYTQDQWLIRNRAAPHVAREAWTVRFAPKVVARFTDAQLANVVKLVGISDGAELVAVCEMAARKALGKHASAARSQPYYLDVTHPQANKGAVVQYLAATYNLEPDDIATIGDMPNDVLMFKKSGVSIAMGNASPEVQASATYVTATNEDEGFAKALEKFVLTTRVAQA
jgi:Cof subfamily protein (haloacid dehalogenase superfamily)